MESTEYCWLVNHPKLPGNWENKPKYPKPLDLRASNLENRFYAFVMIEASNLGGYW
jgi:hypothetical protein